MSSSLRTLFSISLFLSDGDCLNNFSLYFGCVLLLCIVATGEETDCFWDEERSL